MVMAASPAMYYPGPAHCGTLRHVTSAALAGATSEYELSFAGLCACGPAKGASRMVFHATTVGRTCAVQHHPSALHSNTGSATASGVSARTQPYQTVRRGPSCASFNPLWCANHRRPPEASKTKPATIVRPLMSTPHTRPPSSTGAIFPTAATWLTPAALQAWCKMDLRSDRQA